MADIFENDLVDRLFGLPPDQPLAEPGQAGQDRFRAIADQDPTGSAFAAQTMADRFAAFSPADKQRAAALVHELYNLLRNTNITASQPASVAPSFWSKPIDLSAQVTVPAAVGAWTTVVEFDVPNGWYARIAGYGYDVDGAYTYDGSLAWRLVNNGAPVESLNHFTEHRGSIVQPRETYFIGTQSTPIQFQVRREVVAGAPSVVTMAMLGWFWPLRHNNEGTKAATTAF